MPDAKGNTLFASIYMATWGRQNVFIWGTRPSVVTGAREGAGPSPKGHQEFFSTMEMFCILTVAVTYGRRL